MSAPKSPAQLVPEAIKAKLSETLANSFAEFRASLAPKPLDAQTELEQADRDIDYLRDFSHYIMQDVQKRTAHLIRERNTHVPFNRMPPEVISTIFEAIILATPQLGKDPDTGIEGLRLLASVCFAWMRVVKTTPRLWTIVGDYPIDLVALKLRKSGDCPLAVVLQRYHELPDTLRPHPVPLDHSHPVIAQFHRWQRLDVVNLSRTNIKFFQELLLREDSRLAAIKLLQEKYVAPCAVKIVGSPVLKAMDCRGIVVEPTGADGFKNLLRLRVDLHGDQGVQDALRLTQLTPALESLSIRGDQRQWGNHLMTPRLSLPRITLSELVHLSIVNVTMEEATEALNFIASPQVVKLVIAVQYNNCSDDLLHLIAGRLKTAMNNNKLSHLEISFVTDGARVYLESASLDPAKFGDEGPSISISFDVDRDLWMDNHATELPPLRIELDGDYLDPYHEEGDEQEYDSDDIDMRQDSEYGDIDKESISKEQWDNIKEKKLRRLYDERDDEMRQAAQVPPWVWKLVTVEHITFKCPLLRVKSFFESLNSRTTKGLAASWPFPQLVEITIVEMDYKTHAWFVGEGRKLFLETLKHRGLSEDLRNTQELCVFLEDNSYSRDPTRKRVL